MRRVICRKTYFCFPFVPIDRFTCLSPADGVMVKSRMRVLVCVCVLGGGITFDSTPDIAFEFQVRVYIYYSPGRSGGRPIIPFSQSFFFFLFFFPDCPRLSSSNYLNYCLATCLAHLNNSVGSSAGESAHGKRKSV
jgi:hypothetical protein